MLIQARGNSDINNKENHISVWYNLHLKISLVLPKTRNVKPTKFYLNQQLIIRLKRKPLYRR